MGGGAIDLTTLESKVTIEQSMKGRALILLDKMCSPVESPPMVSREAPTQRWLRPSLVRRNFFLLVARVHRETTVYRLLTFNSWVSNSVKVLS